MREAIRLKVRRFLFTAAIVALLCSACLIGGYLVASRQLGGRPIDMLRNVGSSVAPARTVKQALEVLRGEEMACLVTEKIVTQVVAEKNDSEVLLGRRQGVLIAVVELYYGVDLTPEAIQIRNGALCVRVPEPKEICFSVNLGTLRSITKRSVLVYVRDWWMDRDLEAELRAQFHAAATDFLRKQALIRDLLNHLVHTDLPFLSLERNEGVSTALA